MKKELKESFEIVQNLAFHNANDIKREVKEKHIRYVILDHGLVIDECAEIYGANQLGERLARAMRDGEIHVIDAEKSLKYDCISDQWVEIEKFD